MARLANINRVEDMWHMRLCSCQTSQRGAAKGYRPLIHNALILAFLCFVGESAIAVERTPPIPVPAAKHAFLQAHKLCAAAKGKLWSLSLCGPMMFVDEASRAAVLNGPVPGAKRHGAIWHITLPNRLPLGNTAVDYSGQRWTMLLWPLPENKTKRDVLLMHESFHRIQPALGLPAGMGMEAANGHLDTREGRIWLRAEMHALHAALIGTGDDRKRALADALLMRVYRRSLWPQAAEEERELELNEGLAESTGIDVALQDWNSRVKAAIENIKTSEGHPSFVRSFAYATGAAYGQLLNIADPGWRRRVTGTFDFGTAAAKAYRMAMPMADEPAAKLALRRYDGTTIVTEEELRAEKTKTRNLRYKELFVTGRTVTFPLIKSRTSFDPRQVTHFPGHGSVYSVIHINDVWGELSVTDGDALVSPEFSRISLPLTQNLVDGQLSGEGWSATIKKTFRLASDPKRPGSYVVVEKEEELDVKP